MNIILVTKTAIIEKIFSLICKKLNLDLEIRGNLTISNSVDIIVVDEEYVNDSFNSLKQHTKKLGAIVSEELPFDKSRDFILNRPFLPNELEEMLIEQCEYIKDEEENKEDIQRAKNEEEVITNYVESLADDVAYDIDEENDESIVTLASLKDGGVLDNFELNKISDILSDDDIDDQIVVDENDWKDINEIIDDALNEVKDYEFDLDANNKSKPIRLLLNNYNIDELRPFLQKFNQGVIDRLSNGEDVDVTLSLKVNK
jgi:hypothetical protein